MWNKQVSQKGSDKRIRLDTEWVYPRVPVDIPVKILTGTGYPFTGITFPRILQEYGYGLC